MLVNRALSRVKAEQLAWLEIRTGNNLQDEK